MSMSTGMRLITLAIIVGAAVGCAALGGAFGRAPEIREASITPAELQPGEDGVITVRIRDQQGVVDRVEGFVREDRRETLTLNKVEDGPTSEWRLIVDVPEDAPPGDFTIELTAYDARGEIILVPHPDGHDTPLRVSMPMSVAYPDEDEEGEEPEPPDGN